MKRFLLLSYGHTTPSAEIMSAWGKWFESIRGNVVEMAGLGSGREISAAGTNELPLGSASITGFVVVNAESLDDAQRMAAGNPYITSIRVYEIRSK